jgi:LysR substrate binding domain
VRHRLTESREPNNTPTGADHPIAGETSLRFDQSLEHEPVDLLPATTVQTMLQRAAAAAGKAVSYRVIVASFDAAFRVVAAGLGISVVPVEVAETYRPVPGIKFISLTDAWAQRRFVACFKIFDALQPAAQRMVEYLVSRVVPVRSIICLRSTTTLIPDLFTDFLDESCITHCRGEVQRAKFALRRLQGDGDTRDYGQRF